MRLIKQIEAQTILSNLFRRQSASTDAWSSPACYALCVFRFFFDPVCLSQAKCVSGQTPELDPDRASIGRVAVAEGSIFIYLK
jgi:hypothetical protein